MHPASNLGKQQTFAMKELGSWLHNHHVNKLFPVAGFRPGSQTTLVSAKVVKTMLAVLWPFGFPPRFADPGAAQTRSAQTLRALFPVSAALLGHTTRPEKATKK